MSLCAHAVSVNGYLSALIVYVSQCLFLVTGRGGLAITMVTQYDIERVKNIESNISKFHQLEYS